MPVPCGPRRELTLDLETGMIRLRSKAGAVGFMDVLLSRAKYR
jgi:hypothetical protein